MTQSPRAPKGQLQLAVHGRGGRSPSVCSRSAAFPSGTGGCWRASCSTPSGSGGGFRIVGHGPNPLRTRRRVQPRRCSVPSAVDEGLGPAGEPRYHRLGRWDCETALTQLLVPRLPGVTLPRTVRPLSDIWTDGRLRQVRYPQHRWCNGSSVWPESCSPSRVLSPDRRRRADGSQRKIRSRSDEERNLDAQRTRSLTAAACAGWSYRRSCRGGVCARRPKTGECGSQVPGRGVGVGAHVRR